MSWFAVKKNYKEMYFTQDFGLSEKQRFNIEVHSIVRFPEVRDTETVLLTFKDSVHGVKDPRFDFKVSIMSIPIEKRNKELLEDLKEIFYQLPCKMRLGISEGEDGRQNVKILEAIPLLTPNPIS